jgi:hypothetical protein
MRKLQLTIALWLLTVALCFGGGWEPTDYNSGVNVKQLPNNGFSVQIPVCSGHINSLQHDWHGLKLGQTITIQYKVTTTGTPKFKCLDTGSGGGLKCNARPMLFTGDWYDNNGRWWPVGTNCIFVEGGAAQGTLVVKVKPQFWSNVYGKSDAGAFKHALPNIRYLQFCFGCANNFAHGFCNKGGGKVVVTVTKLTIQ